MRYYHLLSETAVSFHNLWFIYGNMGLSREAVSYSNVCGKPDFGAVREKISKSKGRKVERQSG